MNSDNPDVWRAEAELFCPRLHAAALKHLPPEEVKLRQQIETKDAEIAELNKRITDLTFRLSACLAITEQLLDGIVPMADTEARDALFKLLGYADLDNKL